MKTDEIEKLLPCPFCGDSGNPAFHPTKGVKCHKCGAWGPDVDNSGPTAWNTRAPDLAAEVVRLRAERDDWQSRAEFAEAQVEAVQDILPPEAGLLKKRLAEKRAVLEGK